MFDLMSIFTLDLQALAWGLGCSFGFGVSGAPWGEGCGIMLKLLRFGRLASGQVSAEHG